MRSKENEVGRMEVGEEVKEAGHGVLTRSPSVELRKQTRAAKSAQVCLYCEAFCSSPHCEGTLLLQRDDHTSLCRVWD